MSLNHFSSPDLPETLWWTTQQQHPPPMEPSPKLSLYRHPQHPPPSSTTTTFNFNLNHHDDRDDDQESCLQDKEEELPKEHMFEKPLTPSDVGKLNRLVIPKQHAEKYFPLGGDSVEKGLLLAFEDDLGKSWRFRYSYWNSSQSYVLTKGWSRFVKEKRLDAGDVVLFERHRIDRDRLFIGWRRRAVVVVPGHHDGGGLVAQGGIAVAGGGGGNNGWTRVVYNAQAYPAHYPGVGGGGVGNGPGFPYQPDCLHAVAGPNVHNKRPTTPSGNGRRSVRLFGVNLECGPEDYEPATPDGSSSISSQGQGQGQAHYQYFSTSNHQHQQHHMDMNMCRDVNQMRYQQYHQ